MCKHFIEIIFKSGRLKGEVNGMKHSTTNSKGKITLWQVVDPA